MKLIKPFVLALAISLGAASTVQAMGDREQGALIGAGAIILLGSMLSAAQQPSSSTVYYEPRPTVIYKEPYYIPPRVIYVEPPHHRHPHRHPYGYDYYRPYR